MRDDIKPASTANGFYSPKKAQPIVIAGLRVIAKDELTDDVMVVSPRTARRLAKMVAKAVSPSATTVEVRNG